MHLKIMWAQSVPEEELSPTFDSPGRNKNRAENLGEIPRQYLEGLWNGDKCSKTQNHGHQ